MSSAGAKWRPPERQLVIEDRLRDDQKLDIGVMAPAILLPAAGRLVETMRFNAVNYRVGSTNTFMCVGLPVGYDPTGRSRCGNRGGCGWSAAKAGVVQW